MSKTAVIATSTGCLDYLDLTNDNLRIWRMKILVNENTYSDFTEMSAERFYDMLKTDKTVVPSSSMPSMGELVEILEELEGKGYEEVLIVTISSELSGTYGATVPGLNMYEGKMDVRVLDSRNAAISEGYISLEALRLIDEGKIHARDNRWTGELVYRINLPEGQEFYNLDCNDDDPRRCREFRDRKESIDRFSAWIDSEEYRKISEETWNREIKARL